ITKLFNDLYGGKALVEVVNLEKKERDEQKMVLSDEEHYMYEDDERGLRVRRDTSIRKKTNCKNNQNFAIVDDYYDNEFPPIFNISLWLMVILVLTVYAVSVVMWYMDPGRDSVIYRVTSQRMKSE
ncbi:renin receptor, partial [Paramuricea clavata]